MSRIVLIVLVVMSTVFTISTVPINYAVRTETGPAHFWAHVILVAAVASWVIVAIVWIGVGVGAKVDQMEAHLAGVKDRVGDITKAEAEANAVVVELFKHRRPAR